jgi:hypothetical protein
LKKKTPVLFQYKNSQNDKDFQEKQIKIGKREELKKRKLQIRFGNN